MDTTISGFREREREREISKTRIGDRRKADSPRQLEPRDNPQIFRLGGEGEEDTSSGNGTTVGVERAWGVLGQIIIIIIIVNASCLEPTFFTATLT